MKEQFFYHKYFFSLFLLVALTDSKLGVEFKTLKITDLRTLMMVIGADTFRVTLELPVWEQ